MDIKDMYLRNRFTDEGKFSFIEYDSEIVKNSSILYHDNIIKYNYILSNNVMYIEDYPYNTLYVVTI